MFLGATATNICASEIPVLLASGQTKMITVENKDNLLITEDDIIIAENNPSAVVVTKIGGTRWPKATVPFQIDEMMPIENKLNIYRAMIEISYHSKIKFKEISKEIKFKDYIKFIPSDSTICASHVGKDGGMQKIVLAPRCQKGSTMHEILHALGIWHEQSRADRDQYIQILWHNIIDKKQYNFSQHLNDGLDIGEYDYQSIMHYGEFAFSKNGQVTIIPLKNNQKIGQREKLSKLDIKAINKIYS